MKNHYLWITGVIGVVAFDYFFVPPIFSFSVGDLRYLILFAIFLAVAILIATLALRLRMQVQESERREEDTAALYHLSRQMTALGDLDGIVAAIVNDATHTFHVSTWLVLLGERMELTVQGRLLEDVADEHIKTWDIYDSGLNVEVCHWVLRYGKVAGYGTDYFSKERVRYIPLKTEEIVRGVFALRPNEDSIDQLDRSHHLIEAFVGLATMSIARIQLGKEAQIARLSAESERLRTVLLDSISHELRTPLAGILGSVSGMIENATVLSSDDQCDLLFTIRDSAMRMNRLVTNLLGMVRIESGMLALQRRTCDVADMLGVVFRQLQDPLQRRIVDVQLQTDLPPFYVDDVLIEQVLVNILSNAVKYSPDDSRIDIQVIEEDGTAVLMIEDEGIGIPEGDEVKVFDKFYRAESVRRIPGTGLGLAICKGIVEAHGGTICAQRGHRNGARIVIRLPIDESEENDDGCQNSSHR